MSNLSTLLFKLFKLSETVFNSSVLDFRLAKLTFLAKGGVSTPVAFFKSAIVA